MTKKLENTIYGDYTITKYIGKSTWEAKCNKCGFIRTYKTANLTAKTLNYNPGTCTCTNSGINIGDKYGKLTVLSRDLGEHVEQSVYWLCQCECGNTASVTTKRLKSGNTRSCGCLNDEARRERIYDIIEKTRGDMIGRKQGKLTIIRKATDLEAQGRPTGIGYWYCECDCGNHHIVGTSDFNCGKVQSCGCLSSKGEAKITEILETNRISFQKQYYFEDLLNEQGRHYFFDFAIFSNGKITHLIEFDGIQHFSEKQQFSQNENAFIDVVNRDKKKNKYCLEHNIPLIRIPYTQFDALAIKDLLLETTTFLYKKEGDD